MILEEYVHSNSVLQFIEEVWKKKMILEINDCNKLPSTNQIKSMESSLRIAGLSSVSSFIKRQKKKAEERIKVLRDNIKKKEAQDEEKFWTQVQDLLTIRENNWLQKEMYTLLKTNSINEKQEKFREFANHLSHYLVPILCAHCQYLNKIRAEN